MLPLSFVKQCRRQLEIALVELVLRCRVKRVDVARDKACVLLRLAACAGGQGEGHASKRNKKDRFGEGISHGGCLTLLWAFAKPVWVFGDFVLMGGHVCTIPE